MSNRVKPQAAPLPEGLVAADTRSSVGAWVAFTEGPAVDAGRQRLLQRHRKQRILKRTPEGEVSLFRADSGRTNGNLSTIRGDWSVAKEPKRVREDVAA